MESHDHNNCAKPPKPSCAKGVIFGVQRPKKGPNGLKAHNNDPSNHFPNIPLSLACTELTFALHILLKEIPAVYLACHDIVGKM